MRLLDKLLGKPKQLTEEAGKKKIGTETAHALWMPEMKKLFVFLLIAGMLAGVCPGVSQAEEGLAEAVSRVPEGTDLDEKLAFMQGIARSYAGELETGGWNVPMSGQEMAVSLPDGLIPDLEGAEKPEDPSALFQGRKIIPLYEPGDGTIMLLGDFYVRLPEEMRAGSVQEADTILYTKHMLIRRTDYSGYAYNRFYGIYLIDRKDQAVYELYTQTTYPPIAGKGTLTGSAASMAALWAAVRSEILGSITLTYPEGTAVFRIIGKSCSISELKGNFTHYEIPAEVEGYPVREIGNIESETLETLVLPEGIEVIRRIACLNLQSMNFPSTLRRIEENAFYVVRGGGPQSPKMTEWDLNEGLERIGDQALVISSRSRISLPSTLTYIGRRLLEGGVSNPYLVLPEGLTSLPECFLRSTGHLINIYIPEGVWSIGKETFAHGSNVTFYTPEGSYTAQWAAANGYYWVSCDNPEEMPRPEYDQNDEYEYAVAGDEVIIKKYLGNEATVAVPESIDGKPVTSLLSRAFEDKEELRVIVLPDSLARLNYEIVYDCPNLEALFIPGGAAAPPDDFYNRIVDLDGPTYYTSQDAACRDFIERKGLPWAEWTPGLEQELTE